MAVAYATHLKFTAVYGHDLKEMCARRKNVRLGNRTLRKFAIRIMVR
jgi:hypothetical protein